MIGDSSPMVAPTAIVESGAQIADGARIWHHAHVRSEAVIGPQVILGEGVFVDTGVVVGACAKVQNGAQLFAPAIVGEGVFIGPGAILTNDIYPRAIDAIGTMLGAADWNRIGCRIERGASLGAASTIVCTEVGEWALVGAGSVVVKPVPPHALVVGVPARRIGWVCYCGKRCAKECATCGWTVK